MTREDKKLRGGRPLQTLGVVLILWCALRLAYWESPFPIPMDIVDLPELFVENSPRKTDEAQASSVAEDQVDGAVRSANIDWSSHGLPQHVGAISGWNAPRFANPSVTSSLAETSTTSLRAFASHQLLWMAGMTSLTPPPELLAILEQRNLRSVPTPPEANLSFPVITKKKTPNKWSLDSWLFLRQSPEHSDSLLAGVGPRAPSYGASQLGAVLNYHLAPQSPHSPRAYARVSTALANSVDRELATGFSARPARNIPLRAQLELRTRLNDGNPQFRPAALVVSEVPPIKLSRSTRAEGYFQAGYIGGRDATPFADGQFRIDREIVDLNRARLRIGGGTWAGAQKGANRVDIGPSARLELKLGKQPARLDLDYRHRVSGSAEPRSGVALTVSTGF